ncbi:bactoprenol glucosyl transferase [Philodulcilactobacillus myokoensis]|uniref:Bactoprenol glucosyl transferase n=1 Tax=Philodulcilactobacillus myokoensis TaxID=2929573 RepID=A0A9W6B1Y5_9LACO|nr:glycosyltransferase family 2 protein [Philodulcilactobacillus myokoensis]GLB47056.1 bactoprenol glucosyl transferase [Philodulcilactobacillus myokoensis]
MEKIGLIVPCYNEEQSIKLFYKTTDQVFQKMNQDEKKYEPEYLFINDGSSDNTLKIMKDLQREHPEYVHYVSFSRNFGKESAMAAGLNNINGDYVAVMDVDLQDPPALLPKMLKIIQTQDYDCVGCIQTSRKQNPVRAFLSSQFYKVMDWLSDVQVKPNVRDYRLMTRQFVDAVLELHEYNRFTKGIFTWVGFNTTYIKYPGQKRAAGHSHWSMYQLLEYSLEGIIDFSDAPLKFATLVGGISCFLSIIGLLFVVIRAIFYQDSVAGWPSLVSIILLIGGIQLFCLGIVGNYIGKIYLESKNRPKYIIKEKK